jgi:hypothetical protein
MALRILVMTEDSGSDGWTVATQVVGHALGHLGLRNAAAVTFVRPEPGVLPAIRANAWKAKSTQKGQLDRASLAAWLAKELTLSSNASRSDLVVWHIDLDRPFSKRDSSENRHCFDDFYAGPLAHSLAPKPVPRIRGPRADLPQPTPIRVAPLVPMMPAYAMEAWAYQNFDEVENLVKSKKVDPQTTEVPVWRQNRRLVDEVVQIHEKSKV